MEKEKPPEFVESLSHYEKAKQTLRIARTTTHGLTMPAEDMGRLLIEVAHVEALLAICEALAHPNTLSS